MKKILMFSLMLLIPFSASFAVDNGATKVIAVKIMCPDLKYQNLPLANSEVFIGGMTKGLSRKFLFQTTDSEGRFSLPAKMLGKKIQVNLAFGHEIWGDCATIPTTFQLGTGGKPEPFTFEGNGIAMGCGMVVIEGGKCIAKPPGN